MENTGTEKASKQVDCGGIQAMDSREKTGGNSIVQQPGSANKKEGRNRNGPND